MSTSIAGGLARAWQHADVTQRTWPPWLSTLLVAAALAGLVTWSFWQRWLALTDSPFPVGIDGYFYPIQLRSILEGGGLAYPDFPLAFYLMAPFAAVTDPIIGAKLASAVLGALIVLPAYAVGARLGKSRGAGLIAAVIAGTSAGSMFLTIEFVKNGIGLTVALTAIWLVLRALEHRTRGRIVVAFVAVVAALVTHKMAAAIVIVVAVPAVMAEAAGRGALRGRRLFYAIMLVTIAASAWIAAVSNTALIAKVWSTDARWDAPALVIGRIELTMGYEAAIGAVLALLAAAWLHRRTQRGIVGLVHGDKTAVVPVLRPSEVATGWTFVVLALVIGLPWIAVTDPQGLGFRLRTAAFLPMAMCAAIVARASFVPLSRFAAVWQRSLGLIREAYLVLIAIVILLAVPTNRTQGRIMAHPAMVSAVHGVGEHVADGEVIIVPERHIMFMVAWYARDPIRLRADAVPRERRWRLMPLAFIGAGSPLDDALMAARREPSLAPPIGLHPRHPNGLVLVREATWEWILDRLPPGARDHFASWPTI